jgi:hypothetical protein
VLSDKAIVDEVCRVEARIGTGADECAAASDPRPAGDTRVWYRRFSSSHRKTSTVSAEVADRVGTGSLISVAHQSGDDEADAPDTQPAPAPVVPDRRLQPTAATTAALVTATVDKSSILSLRRTPEKAKVTARSRTARNSSARRQTAKDGAGRGVRAAGEEGEPDARETTTNDAVEVCERRPS